jgi:hypothetical protein
MRSTSLPPPESGVEGLLATGEGCFIGRAEHAQMRGEMFLRLYESKILQKHHGPAAAIAYKVISLAAMPRVLLHLRPPGRRPRGPLSVICPQLLGLLKALPSL